MPPAAGLRLRRADAIAQATLALGRLFRHARELTRQVGDFADEALGPCPFRALAFELGLKVRGAGLCIALDIG